MTVKKFNFTKHALEKLPLPEKGKRSYYYDSQTRALAVGITETGTITFIVRRTVNTKAEKMTLGRYPDLSIEAARDLAAEINSSIAKGLNPRQEKRKESSFGDLFDQYLEKHAKPHKKSWKNDLRRYQRHLKDWKTHPLVALSRYNIEERHKQIGKTHGKYAANSVLALLSTLFSKAIHWNWILMNPTLGIKKFKEKSRERFLTSDELPRFFKALDVESNQNLADFFRLCLFTGARRANVLAMRWQDIDLEKSEWQIVETKNGNSQLVPLSPEAIVLLRKRQATQLNDWVFASDGNRKSKAGHITDPTTAWQRVLNAAGIRNLRIHDLRRTLGSWQAATGANSYVIGKSLGHKSQAATAVYARLNIDPVRLSVNKATEAMIACR